MKRHLALIGACLNLAACADAGQQARPVFSLNSEKVRPIAIDPYLQGKEDLAAGQYGHAIEQFQTALRSSPYNVDVLNALGTAYGCLRRNQIARRYFERALSLDPSSPVTLNNLGWSWMGDRNWQMAIRYLQQAQSLDGDDPRIAINLQAAGAAEAQARLAQLSRQPIPEVWIERVSSSVQVLHTKPELISSAGRNSIAVSESWIQASQTTPTSRASGSGLPSGLPETPADRMTAGTPVVIALVNGTGRRGMAARFRDHLAHQGIYAGSLANAVHYNHRRTVILYGTGREQEAERLAAALPLPVERVRNDAAGADLRLRLGEDLLEFDERVLATNVEMKGRVS